MINSRSHGKRPLQYCDFLNQYCNKVASILHCLPSIKFKTQHSIHDKFLNMRLTPFQIQTIRNATQEVAGSSARVRLFGSRLEDAARGGDVDLLLECDDQVDEPALLAARLAARVSHAMGGRKVDVVIRAPNLQVLPIHTIATKEGVLLWG
jgi:predicted nucleotidyltransferase